MTRIIIDPDAEQDLVSICDWYESKRTGLSTRFVAQLDATLESIAERPRSFPIAARTARRSLMDRFPYLVLFLESGPQILVIGVFHTARNPSTWLQRARQHGG